MEDQSDISPAEIEPLSDSQEKETPVSRESRPAMIITIQSWATPIVGIVMLVIGLLLGYVGRPLVASRISPQESPASVQAGNPVDGGESAVSTPTLMEYLVGQTRHFKGNPDAPVTIIEFSDYQ